MPRAGPEGADFEITAFLPYLAAQAADTLSREFSQIYKGRYGMLRTEWRVLFHLGRYGELTAKEICSRANLHKTKVSRAVAALEAKRFLVRAARTTDRRQSGLSLTAQGRRVYEDLAAEAEAFDARVAARLDSGEADILRRALARLAGLEA